MGYDLLKCKIFTYSLSTNYLEFSIVFYFKRKKGKKGKNSLFVALRLNCPYKNNVKKKGKI